MANSANLSNLMSSIQKIMRKDDWVNGDAQRLEQISWMLFLKLFDDKEQEYELINDNYQSPIPEELKWRNWAWDDEWITGAALIDFVNNKLFPKLKEIEVKESIPMSYIIRSVFQDAHNFIKDWTVLRQVINVLDNSIDFNNMNEVHIFNDIYEKLLNDLQSAGNAGEFYTPRAVTQFMVERVQPKLWDKVMDMACGTGWFLTWALEYIRKNDVKTAEDEKLLQKSIYWTEYKQLPHILATTNMILHGIETPTNIRRWDSLARPVNDITDRDMADIILMNPPFWGIIKDGIEQNFPLKFRTKETANLFMVLIIEVLRNWWNAWVVLPDGFLFAEWIETRIKEKLLDECNLHTIIRLPKSVFAPYASVATNLLFFTKWEPTKEIWYYRVDMPEGYKAFSKTKPMQLKHLDCAKDWWNNRIEIKDEVVEWMTETWKAKKFTIDEIKKWWYNLDLCGYPDKVEEEILSPEETANNFIKRREELEVKLDEKINQILSLMK